MKINSLEILFAEELKDVYDAEKRLTRAIPKMAKAANSEELRDALQEHLEQTKGQVSRIEQAFQILGKKAQAKPCAGMKGIIEEGEEVIGKDAEETFADLGIIGAARRVEHYEIAGYRSLISLAEAMGNNEVQELLQQNLEEEEETDRKLAELGESLLQDSESEMEDEAEDEDSDDDEDDELEEEDEEEEAEKAPTPAKRR